MRTSVETCPDHNLCINGTRYDCPKGYYCINNAKYNCGEGYYGEEVNMGMKECSGECPEGKDKNENRILLSRKNDQSPNV